MHKILITFGTRPELIKLAPIIAEFCRRGWRDRLFIVHTGQHREVSPDDFTYFGIAIDARFHLERGNDSLSLLNGLLLLEFHQLRQQLQQEGIVPDALIAQGDTSSAFVAAQFAFFEKIPFLHIEAGLRTDDFNEPFPEEFFRRTMASVAAVHYAPTVSAAQKLLSEGIPEDNIEITGNSAIDNLRQAVEANTYSRDTTDQHTVLITVHRRENIRQNMELIRSRIRAFCKAHPEKAFIWLDNPGYKIAPEISGCGPNLQVIQPVSFREMLQLYQKAQLIITDSGGMQEEAGYLGIPVLLVRGRTERTESIAAGIGKYLEDGDQDLDRLIAQLGAVNGRFGNPLYGDGTAAGQIVDSLARRGFLKGEEVPVIRR